MDKELTIKLKMDRSHASAAVKQHVADSKAAESSIMAAVKASEDVKVAVTRQGVQERIRDERGRFIAVKDLLRSESDAIRGVAAAHRKASQESSQGFSGVKQAIGGVTGSLTDMVAGYMTLRGVAGVVTTLADAWRQVEERQIAAGKAALDYEKKSRELATLMGKGQASQVVPEALDFSLKTGLAATEADNFRRQFLGSLPAGLQKGNITQGVADQLSVQAGVMAARQGGDASTRGDLAGILGQFGKIGSAKEGLGQIEAIRQALTEGRGDDTPLTQALLHVAGTLVKDKGIGAVGSLPELAAVVGTMSLSAGPGMADTRTEQLARGLLGGTSEQQDFMASTFGISRKDTEKGPRDTLASALQKVAPRLKEIGKTQDVASYLTQNKVPEEIARAMVEATENFDVFMDRMNKARAGQQAGGQVLGLNQEFLGSPLGRSMLGENRKLAAEVNRGRTERDYAAMTDLEMAEQNTPEAHTFAQQFADVKAGMKQGYITNWESARAAGERRRIQQGVVARLREQATGLGVTQTDLEKRGLIGGTFTEPEPAEAAKALTEMIRSRGGDPYRSYDESQVTLGNEINRQREMLPVMPQTAVPGMEGVQPNPRGLPTPFQPEPGGRDIVGVLKEIRDKLPEKRTASPVIQNTRPAVQTR
jgi:hypothetical protein